jgi:cell division protein FtsI/penicillin-binding protein 2
VIFIDPTEINQEKIKDYAKKIVKIFPDKKRSQIELFLTKRRVQYVPLKRKISPEISEEIKKLKEKSYEDFKNF